MKSDSKPLGVISHDAGGTEILSSYVSCQAPATLACLAGLAVGVFQRKCPTITLGTVNELLSVYGFLLCGTSWQSDLEWCAMRCTKKSGLKVAAFLGDRVNYKSRFVRGGNMVLPDELWVGMTAQRILLRLEFPDTQVMRMENSCYHDFVDEFQKVDQAVPAGDGVPVFCSLVDNLEESLAKQHGAGHFPGHHPAPPVRRSAQNLEITPLVGILPVTT